ncbi:patatin-like phospholipase family protein [Nocardioides albus]|uniref:NTE family protein n=1 Tax=Nocardioides albus TaxID=1841 RepID=A0A7W5A1F0_9ACTN|nr:patatin-like phospholipase family protein [Nocardioides albus]MBB3087892.1 NTE family protein [Nocardioides albus]GGU21082.1 patatin [Nocardioides albus]
MTLALVLGGGGVAGIAWQTGVLAGLADGGVDLTTADRIIGTSAGSVVGPQLVSGISLPDLFDAQIVGSVPEKHVSYALAEQKEHWARITEGADDPDEAMRRIGDYAVSSATMSEQERLSIIEARLPRSEWPTQELILTSVDIQSGQLRTWSQRDGIPLSHAVAASCAMPGAWPPVTIAGRRYMDGGIQSTTHATLADGCDACLVIAPFPGGLWGSASVQEELEALRNVGTALVAPDEASTRAIGANPLDPATRAPAAQAGRAQGRAEAERIAAALRL